MSSRESDGSVVENPSRTELAKRLDDRGDRLVVAFSQAAFKVEEHGELTCEDLEELVRAVEDAREVAVEVKQLL